MRLLCGGAAPARNDQLTRGEAPGPAATATEQREAFQSERIRLLQGGDDVGGVAARAQRDEEIAGLGQTAELAGKNLLVAKIVADAGDERGVGGKRDGWQGATRPCVAADEFGGEMAGLGRAAAVAADEQLSATVERGDNHLACAIDGGANRVQRLKRAHGLGKRSVKGHGWQAEEDGFEVRGQAMMAERENRRPPKNQGRPTESSPACRVAAGPCEGNSEVATVSRRDHARAMKTILAPIDFSSATAPVVAEAKILARAVGGRVVLLAVIQPPVISGEYALMMENIPEIVAAGKKATAKQLGSLVSQLRREGLTAESIQLEGAPVTRIVGTAKKLAADYLVMGSHGHTSFYDLLVGSTTHGVLKRSPCPVLIIPAADGRKAKARRRKK